MLLHCLLLLLQVPGVLAMCRRMGIFTVVMGVEANSKMLPH